MDPQQPHQTNNLRRWLSHAGPALVLKLIALFIGVGAVSSLLSWLVFNGQFNLASSLIPERSVWADESPELLNQPGFVELAVDHSNLGVVQQFDPPQAVEINGFTLPVSTRYLTDGDLWLPNDPDNNQVGWLENSIINYVFRLPANRGYQDVLANASANQETVTLVTADGKQLLYQLSPANHPADENQPISQAAPAITFIWLDSTGQYHAAQGSYRPLSAQLMAVDYRPQLLESNPVSNSLNDVSVRLDSVELQPNGLQLQTRGIITNKSPDAQIISEKEITLQANGLVSRIVAADPPLPWQIPANNSQMVFSLTLQRLPAAQAQLAIGEQAYQINIID